ncbi:hypothetical protein NPIL_660481 [Nephila pilipes]|uniref:Uncharacterized protein n=1 Tax=Nephila pilipes TaxID=299642 RepID=A0A8X6PE88_NEPPI|nr:hypothetical protein NPIL_660481 [Nephila pilipes]
MSECASLFQVIQFNLETIPGIPNREAERSDRLGSVLYTINASNDDSDHMFHISQLLWREFDSIALPLPKKEIYVNIVIMGNVCVC